jgi:hypothetical protein
VVIKDLPREADHMHDRRGWPGIWSFLWRGAGGGALGMSILLAYIVYRNPYNLVGGLYPLLLFVLIGGATAHS